MNLTPEQRDILNRIEANPEAKDHFEVLCATLETALDDVFIEDLDATSPFGLPSIQDEAVPEEIITSAEKTERYEVPTVAISTERRPPTNASVSIVIAWIELLAQAVEAEDGTISAAALDDDGIPCFFDSRLLFRMALEHGFSEDYLRSAFRKAREGSHTAPDKAMKILVFLGLLDPPKRRNRRQATVRDTIPTVIDVLPGNEVARAVAGDVFYALVAEKGSYEAYRVREVDVDRAHLRRAEDPDVVGEAELVAMSDFSLSLIPCAEIELTAIECFRSFLDEKGFAYERIDHITPTA